MTQTNLNQRTYDVASLKLKGWGVADLSKNKEKKLPESSPKILCKIYIQIATLNVRTIRTSDNIYEIANNFNKCKLSIHGIIDHKILHKNDHVQIKKLNNGTLITTSTWRNSNGAASGGVGLLINRNMEQALAEIKPINEKIVVAVFNGNPNITIVVNYAPIEGSKEAE